MTTTPISLRSVCLHLMTVVCATVLHGQDVDLSPRITDGDTYALVIGISTYQDEKIADLKYAHKDAEAFADFLTSPAGGGVPTDHITFLVNEQATISNVYSAKQNLENKAKDGDLVYFYFAGHGGVEEGLYELGFFLAYDTPHSNYLTNAIRIEDINMMANTLSVTKDVDVVLITDACHSGRLASSDNRSHMLIGDQLRKSQENEIRLASCEPDQLSQEGEAWGGGRGVFSYHLISGMAGKADAGDKDGVVTLSELESYLVSKVPDEVMKVKQVDQVPVVSGKSRSYVAIVDKETLATLSDQVDVASTDQNTSSRSIVYTPSAEDRYFELLADLDLMTAVDWQGWRKMSSQKIIKAAVSHFKEVEDKDIKKSEWRKRLKRDKETRQAYGIRLAAAIHNDIQQLVNRSINGSLTFKGRVVIDSATQVLETCASMLEVAHKLIPEDNYLYNIVGVKKYYMRILAMYIQLPYSDDPDSLIEHAEELKKKALSYEGKTSFLQFKMTYDEAIGRKE